MVLWPSQILEAANKIGILCITSHDWSERAICRQQMKCLVEFSKMCGYTTATNDLQEVYDDLAKFEKRCYK